MSFKYSRVLCLLIAASLLFLTWPVAAQSKLFSGFKNKSKVKAIPTFKPEQLRADFAIFHKALQEAHPGLYRYTSKPTFKTRFDSVYFSLSRPHTEQDFYKSLKYLVTNIRCANTILKTANRTEPEFPYHTDQLFPVQLYFNNGKAYALNSFTDSAAVPANAEIVAINGRKMNYQVSDLMPYVSFADGQVTSSKYRELGDNFSGYIATFGEAKPVYEITFRTGDNFRTVRANAAKLEQVRKVKLKDEAFKKLPAWSLEFQDKKIAVLTLATFQPDKSLPDFEEFLETAFAKIKNSEVKTLIIDLRDNKEGNDKYGALLYAYLTDKPFRFYRQINTNTNRRFTFLKYGHVPLNFFFYRRLLKMNPDSTFRYTYHSNLKEQKPQLNAFAGNLYILQSGRTFGSAAEFAAVAHSRKRATIIGQETAGAYRGSNGGKYVQVKLPNSKFELSIPLWAISLDVDEKQNLNRGVLPQYPASPTSEQILSGYDREIEFTLELIRRKNEVLENKVGE
ncbi:S41 family peptidase [Adhaeribacter soli]|uniref:Tail specific protease domain-containing protein n=1 Tax=Adhaeribacter soli TaxID=2607655 RepID=A0A5N1IWP8_9BACT|nr:S41 family peptidase [Adhaeribacter soli]KAA9338935.1 hypothetical protein F0P94_09090 [Adhaeribacter soli]